MTNVSYRLLDVKDMETLPKAINKWFVKFLVVLDDLVKLI